MGLQDLSSSKGYGYSGYSSSPYAQYAPQPTHSMPSAQAGGSRKRKAASLRGVPSSATVEVIDLTEDEPCASKRRRSEKLPKTSSLDYAEAAGAKPKKRTKKAQLDGDKETASKPKKKAKAKDEEKRLRRWRDHPPTSYLEVKDRALTQRMFALDRQRSYDNPDHPTEIISLAGTTGNVYTIVIDKVPSCDCPHAKKGNQCKHIAYVLSIVLRVPAHLEYQLAFISSELREIFEKAPPLPSETADTEAKDGNRKPIEGECPICVCDFEPEGCEAIVYCKAACGNNVHKSCFQEWAASKRGQTVTCPFCRKPWQSDDDMAKNIAKTGPVGAESYVNVASQLGLSGRRDYSSYHSYWVRRQADRGEISWEDDGVIEHEYAGGRW
jgi:hypothetical protein